MGQRITAIGTKSGSVIHLSMYDKLPRVGSDTLKGAYLTSCGRLIEHQEVDFNKYGSFRNQVSCKKCIKAGGGSN